MIDNSDDYVCYEDETNVILASMKEKQINIFKDFISKLDKLV